MVGTIATVSVVSAVVLSALVMFVKTAESNGFSHAGGDREYVLYSTDGLSLALGIVAYCFSGHAIVPSIYQ
jgi:vesicular inhibitory amino acid transporter